MKSKIFSITKKDLTIQTFRSGGKGGQHQNKTDSGVRIIHKDSGAVGESRNHKSQYVNKKEAFKRLVSNTKFKLWVNRKVIEIDSGQTIEEKVKEQLKPENLRYEIKNEKGKWIKCLKI